MVRPDCYLGNIRRSQSCSREFAAEGTGKAAARHSREPFGGQRAAAFRQQPRQRTACNHFEVGETLNNPYGPFGRAALEMMRLA